VLGQAFEADNQKTVLIKLAVLFVHRL